MNHCDLLNKQIIVDSKVQTFFIRTLCSYEPYLDKGLPGKGLKFKPGDLLLVTNANDDRWWQAIHIGRNYHRQSQYHSPQLNIQQRGLIPSISRVQSKSQLQRRHVEFDSKAVVIGPTGKLVMETICNTSTTHDSNNSGSNSFDLRRLRKFQNNSNHSRRPIKDEGTLRSDNDLNFTFPYEIVEQMVITEPRPVVLIGPGKDAVYEYLLRQYNSQYNTPIPHTSRPPRPGEKEGVDYYFVTNRQELEDSEDGIQSSNHHYIDVGKFKGNLYANSVESIQAALDCSKHPLLDISHSGIEKLRSAGIYPICVLINPPSLSICRTLQQPQPMNSNSTSTVHPSAARTGNSVLLDVTSLKEYTTKLEKEFSVLFDDIISPTSLTDLKEKVLQVINTYQQLPTWVRSKNQSFC